MNQKVLTMSCLKNILKALDQLFLAKTLFETKDKKKNDVLVNVISSGLKDLKEEITDMSKGEKKIAKTDDIVKVTNYFSSIKSRKQF